MKIILRILSVAAILIAALFLLIYLVAGVELWRANQPTTTTLVNALTAVDQVLQKTDPILEKVAAISGDVARIGNEIGGAQDEFSQTANSGAGPADSAARQCARNGADDCDSNPARAHLHRSHLDRGDAGVALAVSGASCTDLSGCVVFSNRPARSANPSADPGAPRNG